jgi:hypothetical protein
MTPEGYAQRSSILFLASPRDHYEGSEQPQTPRNDLKISIGRRTVILKQHRCLTVTQAVI